MAQILRLTNPGSKILKWRSSPPLSGARQAYARFSNSNRLDR